MLSFLPPIGHLDISGGSRVMIETKDEEKERNDALFAGEPQSRPQSPPMTSSTEHYNDAARLSSTSCNLLTVKRGSASESHLNQETTAEEQSSGFVVTQVNKWTNLDESSMSVVDLVTVGNSRGEEKIPAQDETACERTAETKEDYEQGQPQKLSFEDELTFIPKLNALSLKIAQSRTSVAKRIKVSCENRVAALEEEMAQNFTFRPCISENSVRIADRLKTNFWTRQRLHTEKQRKMLENVPSTWHPRTKTNAMSKQYETIQDNNLKEKHFGPSFSESIQHKTDLSVNWVPDLRKDGNESIPYPKATGRFFHKQKKSAFQEFQPKRLESLKPRALKKLEQRRIKHGKVQESLDDTALNLNEHNSAEPSTPQKYASHIVSNSIELSTLQKSYGLADRGFKYKTVHKRSKTMPLGQASIVHRPFVVDPDRFLKTKSSAEEALRNKKIFICMGPYPVLRACLRRRGWIEKYFKADIACSNLAKDRSPDKFSRDSDDDDDNDDSGEEAGDKGGGGETEATKQEVEEVNCAETKVPCRPAKSLKCGHGERACGSNFEKNVVANGRYAYGNTAIGNFEDLDEGFESDSQYGIMSRIARNAVPTLIWTCRRSDIEFNYLTKDQIVNHFAHASSFTTKFGICVNIRNVPFFESVDPDSFFPRCHRLSSDSERQDFIDEFRMLSAIAILRYMITTLNNDDSLNVANYNTNSIPAGALLLAMKACRGYLRSKHHFDIEEDQKLEVYGLSEEKWNDLVEFFYQLTRKNGMIVGAESYKNDCEKILHQMEAAYPQCSLHEKNVWIIKPGAKSRGRGILVMDNLHEILKLSSGNSSLGKKENRWVVQKYIERPLLIYNTKFDIRQWFLVTDWNPFTLWFYKDCYLRFCSQEFTLSKFDPEYHLANNSIQKDYTNGPRSNHLPMDNMWTKDQFISHLRQCGHGEHWDEVIYPSMKQSIIYALLACQDSLEYRKNSFELYGADFMISEDMRPWLIEINSSPAMGASTAITQKLCAEVIEDTLKVVLDRRDNRSCDTGKFEIAYKQQYIPIPVYNGSNLIVEGEGWKKPIKNNTSPQQNTIHTPRSSKIKEMKERKHSSNHMCAKKVTVKFLSPRVVKKLPEKSINGPMESREPVHSTRTLKKEARNLLSQGKKDNLLSGYSCAAEDKCPVVSAYHVQNSSLEATSDDSHLKISEDSLTTPRGDSSQNFKVARMRRKTKKRIAYATLRYHRSNDGPGLSISPGHGVTQI